MNSSNYLKDKTKMMTLDNLKTRTRKYLNKNQRELIRYVYCSLFCPTDLNKIATIYGTDKWNVHYYTQHYQKHFETLRKKRLNILEIGIGGYKHPDKGGESLRMWRTYFPNSMLYGIDIYDKKAHDERRIKTFQGSQADPVFLKEVAEEIGSIDIIIDDGSHINEHVILTFKTLFPLLKENGIYVVEDTESSYWPQRGGNSENLDDPATLMNFFKTLVDGLNYEEFMLPEYKHTYFDKHIVSMHFYHNLLFICKGLNNEGSILVN